MLARKTVRHTLSHYSMSKDLFVFQGEVKKEWQKHTTAGIR
jgi:hypothetical protein